MLRSNVRLILLICLAQLSAKPLFSQLQTTKHVIDSNLKNAHSVLAVDVDKDGRIDIVAGSFKNGLRLYKNAGNGSFGKKSISNFQGSRIYAEDVDRDGDVDVIAASPIVDELIWLENDGNENFTSRLLERKSIHEPGGFESVFAKDLTGDGRPEILSADWFFDEMAWWENKGAKNFNKHIFAANFVNAHSVHAADFDRDGDFDVIGSRAGETVIWFNNGKGGLSRRRIDTLPSVLTLWSGDIDGDGDLDVTRMANVQSRKNRVLDWLENDGSGSFTKHTIHVATGDSWLIPGVVNAIHGDVDGDGRTDIVTAGLVGGEVNFWKNDGNENFSKIRIDSNLKNPIGVATLDFDKDGDHDIVVAVEKENSVILYEVVGSIKSNPTLTILAPNGGERWTQNTSQSIRWKSTGTIDQVKLEYSTDIGKSWTTIAASTQNDGAHDWSLPNVESSTSLVRISDSADGNPTDNSDAVFSIVGQVQGITLTSPNGGEKWLVNSRHSISWTSAGVGVDVKLDYSLDDGQNWTVITNSTPNDGNHNWTVPDILSNACLVRITDAGGNLSDISDRNFSIVNEIATLIVDDQNPGYRELSGHWKGASGGTSYNNE
ncbi:MAG: VCBS repeat-containing protein, partial [bacterium]